MRFVIGDIANIGGVALHGVNACGAFGAGVAKSIASRYPDAKRQYENWIGSCSPGLGEVLVSTVEWHEHSGNRLPYSWILHGVTQLNYGRMKNFKYADLEAVCMVMDKAAIFAVEQGLRTLYIPYIGCGLGGLDFDRDVKPCIKAVERKHASVRFEVVVVSFGKAK